jgi:hypothetical protein
VIAYAVHPARFNTKKTNSRLCVRMGSRIVSSTFIRRPTGSGAMSVHERMNQDVVVPTHVHALK